MLKKTTLAILGLSISSWAAAGTMGPVCTPDAATVPCETKMWDIGIDALFLRAVYDADMGYGIATINANDYKEIDNDWGWGYRLHGSYHFRTGNDITMTWLHYDVDTRHGYLAGTFPLGILIVPSYYNLYVDNQFDQVNLIMGQHVDYGVKKNVRYYGGFQYADIRVDSKLHYLVPAQFQPIFTQTVDGLQNTDFSGVGPVVGADFSYNVTPTFSVIANIAGSILYGSSRYNDSTFYSQSLVVLSRYGSKKSMVPSLEMKLGGHYEHPVAQGTINVEAGYQVINYFNALHTLTAAGTLANSDFGLYGPYVGVKWVGNV
ncbi:Lpg1974 family pore-forming outer membrane protein [Legionella spiritensis]|uniref:Outer membrane protein n=1 Tax=Legionella spiritensis TaxID=452 RepID=A0A0W0ZBF2_LEGSP|nr:Lpg1974 family pore-forming outer membrane protein [Legionella spiritensis]KTD66298.1 outer membrane protein [Legionella spiritensis]SNV48538.1 major outer membrane protein [Legionella spiritensis]VEG91509.1 major outer membrane protein [Legionella spiritensis]